MSRLFFLILWGLFRFRESVLPIVMSSKQLILTKNILKIIKNTSIILVIFLLLSCETVIKETVETTEKELPNGKSFVVNKTNIISSSMNIIENLKYGTKRRSYSYKISIPQDRIEWYERKRAEPKNIIFHKDIV